MIDGDIDNRHGIVVEDEKDTTTVSINHNIHSTSHSSSHYADPDVWSPTKEYKLRAGCVVYDESGTNILLVNSTRHGSDRMTHTIPSGKVESFDQDLETAASEFRERMWCSVSRALSLLGRKKPHYRLALHMAANKVDGNDEKQKKMMIDSTNGVVLLNIDDDQDGAHQLTPPPPQAQATRIPILLMIYYLRKMMMKIMMIMMKSV
ncbi:hypothetical protein Pmar_PMAR028934 [Perkinsus marinus ATCC 50983]|uniref:Uncharacterized protein n=1 Tax=Perkinsus marinus (strain ATCC 50983 / TXsc) TaxID=423536 RepID=C5LCU2_PERM5|nr:hypothetical protein Pmar_PMAR028934 [Perkinsus marinus ATCC 50983]EER05445.1 hypothetical protein Pmar_PMAR028934 [Perkinsus marinus ATCC 50983]|eukprot:XP_002773629.1 hypothetical protein Pmar_PMAR028934 [Perkinsus marinus ATCC 50983]